MCMEHSNVTVVERCLKIQGSTCTSTIPKQQGGNSTLKHQKGGICLMREAAPDKSPEGALVEGIEKEISSNNDEKEHFDWGG